MTIVSGASSTEQAAQLNSDRTFSNSLYNDHRSQLSLRFACLPTGKTVLRDRYMAYPLSLSPLFRLESGGRLPATDTEKRAYAYRMNTSPGLLAGDRLGMSVCLEANSAVYLADQAATKVHTMPAPSAAEKAQAQVSYEIVVGDRAALEFLPEPLILFADSALRQTTDITLHPTAGLAWGEIVVPGRLARGECYQFRELINQIQISAPGESPWFVERMKLVGKGNSLAHSSVFASGPVLGTLILVLPGAIASRQVLDTLSREIDALGDNSVGNDSVGNDSVSNGPAGVSLANSVLPGDRGLFVRAIGQTAQPLQAHFKTAVNCARALTEQAPLPYSIL